MDAGWLRARNMVGSSWRILWRPPFSSNAGSCTSYLVVPSSNEQTKDATTAKQFIGAGFKTEDLAYDIKKGFVEVLGENPKRRKRAQKGWSTAEQKDAMVTRYLEIIEEHQS